MHEHGLDEMSCYSLHQDTSRKSAQSSYEGPSVRERVYQEGSADDGAHRPPISQTSVQLKSLEFLEGRRRIYLTILRTAGDHTEAL